MKAVKYMKEDAMTEKFILFCEYIHCCGRQKLVLDKTDNEARAAEWVKQQEKQGGRPRLLENDLVLNCPVNHCPAKRQVPRYDYHPDI